MIIAAALCALAAVCASHQTGAQSLPSAPTTLPSPLSLSEAIAIAKAHQPDIFTAKTNTTSAEGAKIQAQAGYLPQVKATYTGTGNTQKDKSIQENNVNGTIVSQSVSTTTVNNTHTGAISLSQNIFDLGIREATNSAARNSLRAAKYSETATLHTSVLSVISAYYTLLADIDQVKVADAQVKRYQETVNLTQAQIDAKVSAKNDIYQANANLASAKITLSNAQNAVLIASSELKSDLGVDTNDVVNPVPISKENSLPDLPEQTSAPTLDECLKTAFTKRPDYLADVATLDAAEANFKSTKLQQQLTVSVDYSLSLSAINAVSQTVDNSTITATVSAPIFDGGTAKGAIKSAQASRDASRIAFEKERLSIRSEIEQALYNRNNSYETLKFAKAAVDSAQTSYDSALASRKEGVNTYLDVMTAENSLTSAQAEYVADFYTYYNADATLQKALGALPIEK
jgi:outer membrane protein TolC